MNDTWVSVNQPQQLLKVDAGNRCNEIDTGAPQAQMDSLAWIHINVIPFARPINLCRDDARRKDRIVLMLSSSICMLWDEIAHLHSMNIYR